MEVPAKFKAASVGFNYWLLILFFMAIPVFLISCSGSTTFVPGPTGDLNFTIVSYLQDLESNQTTDIVVSVTRTVTFKEDDGTTTIGEVAEPGVTVTFEIINNLSGCILSEGNPSSVVTGPDGRVSVTYTSGSEDGVADTVRARLSGVGYEDAVINVNPPGVGTTTVTVSATPSTLEAVTDVGADNQAIITATVTNSAGVVVGEDVTFTSSAGTLCTYPACDTITTPPQTNAQGIARVILQSSINLETANVEAQVGLESSSTAVIFVAGPASSFELFASPTNLRADGNSTSTVTAVVTDSAGHLVVDDTTVNFSVKNTSTGGGTIVNATTGLPPATGQTVGGVATASFVAGTTVGTVNIRASSGGVDSDDVDINYGDNLITLIPEFVGSVSVVVDPSTLTADGTSKAQAVATVLNTDGFPVNAGTSVTFTTSGGELDTDFNFTNPQASVTTATLGNNGEVSIFLRSSTLAGQNFVTATSGGRSGAAQVEFIAGVANADNSVLSVSPTSIPADGTSTALLTLNAFDSVTPTPNPVADETPVGFSANDPGVNISPNPTTTTNGVATATITSTNTPGTVTLSAAIGTIVETTTITFGLTAGADPNTIDLALSDTYLTVVSQTGSDAITIEATVNDQSGSPIGIDCNNNITFTKIAGPADVTLDGSTSPVTKTTNGGVAFVVLNAGIIPGTVQVQVTATQDSADCVGGTPVSVLSTAIIIASGPAKNLFLFPESEVIDEPGSSLTSRIYNAMVTDQYGNPVENNTAVSFNLTDTAAAGVQICPTGYTGIITTATDCAGATTAFKGVARTKLSWPPELIWSTFTLNAETSGGAISDQIINAVFPAVEDVVITTTVIPTSVTGSCASCIDVAALYEDGSAPPNPLIGRTVTFSSSNTSLVSVDTATDITDDFGQASTTLSVTCGAFVGTETVTITAAETPYFGEETLSVTCP